MRTSFSHDVSLLTLLKDPLRTRAIPERVRGVFTTRCYTNPHWPYLYLIYAVVVNNNNNNNNLSLVKTSRSTLHAILCNGSNDTTKTVTQDSNNNQVYPKGYRLPETDGAKVLPTSDQVGFYLASIHQMALSAHIRLNRPATQMR